MRKASIAQRSAQPAAAAGRGSVARQARNSNQLRTKQLKDAIGQIA